MTSGNITNLTGTAATFTGNVTVGGVLTYEDVTNVDSIGIVTARSGLNVVGGGLTVTGVSTFFSKTRLLDDVEFHVGTNGGSGNYKFYRDSANQYNVVYEDISGTEARFIGNVSGTGNESNFIFLKASNTLADFTQNGIKLYASSSEKFRTNDGGVNITGVCTATSFSGNGSDVSRQWTLGADGTSNYTFTGPGLTGAENDPTLYLTRGQQYQFVNNMGAHPFRIQSTPNGSTGTQYNDGITNNDVSNGTLTWDVQFDAPNILYYQCTSHPNMGGPIYIVPRSEPAVGVRTEVSGTTGSVGAAATTDLDITGFKSYGLLKVGISSAAWVRLYVDGASGTSDATRSYLVDPTPGSGLIAEVRTETAGISTFLMSPGVIGWNNDVSVGSTIYAAVTNNESSSATITVDLTVVKMED